MTQVFLLKKRGFFFTYFFLICPLSFQYRYISHFHFISALKITTLIEFSFSWLFLPNFGDKWDPMKNLGKSSNAAYAPAGLVTRLNQSEDRLATESVLWHFLASQLSILFSDRASYTVRAESGENPVDSFRLHCPSKNARKQLREDR